MEFDQRQAVRAATAVGRGVSPICATCAHYWTAKDSGAPKCQQRCGGPLAGRMFPKYKGPLGSTQKAARCFMSGEPATYGVRVILRGKASKALLGISASRLERFAEMAAQHGLPGRKIVILDKEGEARLLTEFLADTAAHDAAVDVLASQGLKLCE